MSVIARNAPNNVRKGRPGRLTLNDPIVNSAVAAINFTGFNISETKTWGNGIAASARLWLAGRHLQERGRISKADAHRMFNRAFGSRHSAKGLFASKGGE